MASITVTFVHGVDGTVTLANNLTDNSMDRLIAALRQAYPNDDGTQPSKANAIKDSARAYIQGLKDMTIRKEQIDQASAINVPPIPSTEP